MMKSFKSFLMNVLNGSALGVIAALIPGALLGELFKALTPTFPALAFMTQIVSATNTFVGFAIGVAVAIRFALNPLETITVGMTTMLAGGSLQFLESGLQLKGTGDIITMCVTAGLAVAVIQFLRPLVGAYAILVIPTLTVIVAGGLGRVLYPYFILITGKIGEFIAHLLTLEQTTLCICLAIIFALIIVSPISSVGIGIAISLAGVGSGAANLGIVACGFALAIAGRRVNSLGTCIAHFIGSPKLSMPNIISHPKLLLPICLNAGIMGLLASVFYIQGTPLSAGFGLSGLVGPVNHLNIVGWTAGNGLVTVLLFVVAPIVLGFASDYLFVTRLGWIDPENYRITI